MAAERWFDTYRGRILLVLAFLTLVVGFAAWQYPKLLNRTGTPAIYAMRVQVKSPAGEVLRDSRVSVSAGNEAQLLSDGSWEIEIAAAKVPADGKVAVTVGHDDWASAQTVVKLGVEPNPYLRMTLKPRPPASGLLVGTVLDADDRGVSGARVSVMGYSVPVVETDGDGRFEVRLPVAAGEKVKLHVASNASDPEGPPPRVAHCYMGAPCEIWLQEQEQGE